MDRNLDPVLPRTIGIVAHAGRDAVDGFAIRGVMDGGAASNALLPCEYRGLSIGPLLVGTYGYTDHVLIDGRAVGCWFASAPHAPNHWVAGTDDDDLVWAGAAVRPGRLPATFRGRTDTSSVTPALASLRQLGAEDADAVYRDCGQWTACSLRIGAARKGTRVRAATLAVRVLEATGNVKWHAVALEAHHTAKGWVFDRPPHMVENAPPAHEPSDVAGPLGFALRARRPLAWPFPPWPERGPTARFEAFGEMVGGALVMTATLSSADSRTTNAIFVMGRSGETATG